MAIIVQRTYRIPPAEQDAFTRENEDTRWPALLDQGVQMVANGIWVFGGPPDVVVTHLRFHDFEHLEAVGGPTLRREHNRDGDRAFTSRLIELDHKTTTATRTMTGPTSEAAEPPPTFGAGSVISERTYRVPTEVQGEFQHASEEVIWPWLEQAGGRLIASGHDPFSTSDELVTLFAFRSLVEWHRLSRPAAELQPPEEVVGAWVSRSTVIDQHWGRLLTITTDFGRLA